MDFCRFSYMVKGGGCCPWRNARFQAGFLASDDFHRIPFPGFSYVSIGLHRFPGILGHGCLMPWPVSEVLLAGSMKIFARFQASFQIFMDFCIESLRFQWFVRFFRWSGVMAGKDECLKTWHHSERGLLPPIEIVARFQAGFLASEDFHSILWIFMILEIFVVFISFLGFSQIFQIFVYLQRFS